MQRWLSVGVLVGGAALSACGTELTNGGANVRMGTATPAGAVCDDLGVVYGSAGEADATAQDKLESSQNDLRNKTAALGGNFVLMDIATADDETVAISGHALSCSSGAPAGAVAVAPAATEFSADAPAPVAPSPAGSSAAPPAPTPEQRLRALEDLRQKGLITDAEYQDRRKQVLDGI